MSFKEKKGEVQGTKQRWAGVAGAKELREVKESYTKKVEHKIQENNMCEV